jgi:hypothetical protein
MILPRFYDLAGDDLNLERTFAALAKTIAVDFDGVLHPYTKGWTGPVPEDEPPSPGAREFLEWCAAAGYRVVVFSTRAQHQEGFDGILDWLEQWNLSRLVFDVTHTKPPAVAYVDDRAVPFVGGDWTAVREGIDRLTRGPAHGAVR